METDIQKPLLTSPPFDGVWNGAVLDERREKGKKRMGAFPGASRPVPRLQEGCPCCVQKRNVFFRSRSIEKVREMKKYSKFVKKYEELRRSLQDADGIDRIIAKHLKKRDSKVIVFCPNQKKLQEFMLLRREWFGRVNKEVHAYKTTSADPYGSRDFQEFKEDSSSALKVLYCINQLNEAVHVKGIDAIVMVRPTKSPVIFQQQLGRALTSGGNRTPLVFDLCNNFGSLGGIAGMQERMERAYEKKSEQGEKPIYEPKDFHVIDEIKDPRELAEELREALNPSTTIDEKISFLEEIAAQNGGQL